MKVVCLGTASCYPTVHRGVSCTAIVFEDGDVWLFDCGENTQVQIQKSSIHSGRISKIFITHLHGDHLFGLPGLMCTLGCQERDRPLELYGPLGLRRYIRESLYLSYSPLSYKFKVHELVPLDCQYPEACAAFLPESFEASGACHPQEEEGSLVHCSDDRWLVLKEEKGSVVAGRLEHRVPCFGFTLTEPHSPGRLKASLLQSLGVPPGPLYSEVKKGRDITLSDGRIITAESVTGPAIPGRIVTILGDTKDSSAMTDIARDSDILFHEATLEDSMMEKALEHGHSTPSMAAAFAARTNARKLVLFHVSQRYKDQSADNLKEGDYVSSVLQEEAIKACQGLDFSCEVILAKDLLEIELPKKKLD